MVNYRTTERALSLLTKSTTKSSAPKKRFARSRPAFEQPRRTLIHPWFIPKIRIRDEDVKRFATLTPAAPLSGDLLNPNKPNNDKLKHVVVKPIVPLTQPRFLKSSAMDTLPSVTKILQATMPASSRYMLEKWEENMIKELGEAGFAKYKADTFERGRALHAILADYLITKKIPATDGQELSKQVVSNLWNSIEKVVSENIYNPRLVEHTVTHREMKYRGIVDCVAFYKDELVVIDFKTAEKPKKDVAKLYDNPLQVTAYCAALNHDQSIPKNAIDRNIVSGLVIVAYIDGSEATLHYLSPSEIQKYWKTWMTRLDQYAKLEAMNVARKLKETSRT